MAAVTFGLDMNNSLIRSILKIKQDQQINQTTSLDLTHSLVLYVCLLLIYLDSSPSMLGTSKFFQHPQKLVLRALLQNR
ncbi:hypothetical protein AQUCO_04100207v1 [Aquilegia coerulea]|uniref:Uncharacterized protein n=1 Tax=Aquilegia coerulea TaxID=218851 RepID=A0A2G5CQT3_AQUCA|nr:hypothetical protein AQUCO_04100207v1 [Aquilegia coerulea]